MKKNLFFALFTLLFTINFVMAADWIQIGEKLYLDASSWSQYDYYGKDGFYSIWTKSLNNGDKYWKEVEGIFGKKLWYEKILYVFNCAKKEMAIKSSVYYDLKDNVVNSNENSILEWHSIVPESIGELKYMHACGAVPQSVQNTYAPNDKNIIQTPTGVRIRVKSHR
ncbi:MAG: hypothetical protein IKR34_00430 [Candidatus Gastranaerophilales bacterium]|nr:hypothetical protein [Candidatus Gastranaerophilales bacterium]